MPTAVRRVRERIIRALDGATSLDDQVAQADQVLREVLGADLVAWGTVDPATMLSTSCATFGQFDESEGGLGSDELTRERRLFELEWEDRDVNTFGDMLRRANTAASLRASVDGDMESVRRYRDLLRPLGAVDELRLMCMADGLVWSTAIFYRTHGRGAFDQRDVQLAAAASEPLARAFRHAMLRSACDAPAIHEPPGALLVGADGSVLASSFAAEALLSTANERHIGTTLRNLATRIERSVPAVARISGSGGVLLFHASAAKGVDGVVSIVVERPRRVELAPLIMGAYGFTHREREVVERILHGAGRGTTARSLGVGEDTVGRHLTNAYRKAGVGSHAELAALLFGTFFEEPRGSHTPPSPYGHFIPTG